MPSSPIPGPSAGKSYLYFKIRPKGTSLGTITPGTGKLKVNWTRSKSKNTSGYQIEYSTSKAFKTKYTRSVTLSGRKNSSTTLTKLKATKKYYIRIRTYKVLPDGVIYSKWSKVKTQTTK